MRIASVVIATAVGLVTVLCYCSGLSSRLATLDDAALTLIKGGSDYYCVSIDECNNLDDMCAGGDGSGGSICKNLTRHAPCDSNVIEYANTEQCEFGAGGTNCASPANYTDVLCWEVFDCICDYWPSGQTTKLDCVSYVHNHYHCVNIFTDPDICNSDLMLPGCL